MRPATPALAVVGLRLAAGQSLAQLPTLPAADYAPQPARCPAQPLTRPASAGISPREARYVGARKANADAALASWLAAALPGLEAPGGDAYPTLALATSGGGFRAMLTGAGVHQALDGCEPDGTSTELTGLYQALTYETGLSGGSWLLGSLAGNGWPAVSELRDRIWDTTIADGLLSPGTIVDVVNATGIAAEVLSKKQAGFETSFVDVWGRLQGYSFLSALRGGLTTTLSGVAHAPAFEAAGVPFPIITAVQLLAQQGACLPGALAAQFEFSPFEYGSWDSTVATFQATHFMGSAAAQCTRGFDRLALIMGTSSNIFPDFFCEADLGPEIGAIAGQIDTLANVTEEVLDNGFVGNFPNFAGQDGYVTLVDGGFSDQEVPLWPLLHRAVDVVFAVDASADTSANFANGSELAATYAAAMAEGVGRMPQIPAAEVVLAEGLNKRPTFFGCRDEGAVTVVWLPNADYVFPSGTSTLQTQYSVLDIEGMLLNGQAVATNNGTQGFGACVGCAIMAKSGVALPEVCGGCLDEYCYN